MLPAPGRSLLPALCCSSPLLPTSHYLFPAPLSSASCSVLVIVATNLPLFAPCFSLHSAACSVRIILALELPIFDPCSSSPSGSCFLLFAHHHCYCPSDFRYLLLSTFYFLLSTHHHCSRPSTLRYLLLFPICFLLCPDPRCYQLLHVCQPSSPYLLIPSDTFLLALSFS